VVEFCELDHGVVEIVLVEVLYLCVEFLCWVGFYVELLSGFGCC